ncbi:MAG TPA: hypothetical protein VH418_14145 [Solirubrobacteraceae bacterium]|jgi:hypothetical protein
MNRRARVAGALAAAAVALGAPAAPALADGFTLKLAPQSEAVVGRPLLIQAIGTMPPHDVFFPYWFTLDAIPTRVTTTCPPDRYEGAQFANANGGSIVVFLQAEHPDLAGNFTIPVAVTPSAPGTVLLCGYTDDGADATLARASLLLHIRRSRAPSPPEYAAQGVRSCRALLSGASERSCVRRIVRKANRRCRRLPSRHARTRCLRAVRRAR